MQTVIILELSDLPDPHALDSETVYTVSAGIVSIWHVDDETAVLLAQVSAGTSGLTAHQLAHNTYFKE